MAGEREPRPAYGTFATPAGELTVIAAGPAVLCTSFRGVADALSRFAALDEASPEAPPRPGPLEHVASVLRRYARGDVHALEEIQVRQPGGPFRQRAWAAMRQIKAGTTDTYAGLAARAGSPLAYRAAGTACSTNLVAPFVPCHRVLAAHGVGAYGYGVPLKVALLRHEGVEPEECDGELLLPAGGTTRSGCDMPVG